MSLSRKHSLRCPDATVICVQFNPGLRSRADDAAPADTEEQELQQQQQEDTPAPSPSKKASAKKASPKKAAPKKA
eukprot:138978-Pelagomonas_calceolata.AAC.1